ncbi:6-carboxytetrahydropterin synthase @ Queuosine biosynthesis QueD, PTPS-I [hydrothermal vent metagenome]|uniref:6-carboxytetrahydropterin synthase @ Queuosine biosynthesis QueD, PTPS-I n=1 Tax=hydrothermal vent metagenome TaxID=652676 RepID=A0A3B1AQU2_9ZZZZ
MAGRFRTKIVTEFSAAHLLRGYPGVCSRLHGHNWKVDVEVVTSELDEIGMGMDFRDIKAATNELIGALDHRNLNDLPPFDKINPTAENISAYIFKELSKELNNERVQVDRVTIWETDRACVTYSEE